MVYIFETEISNKKTITYSLQKIFGLGNKTSHKICKKLGFSNNLKVNDLSKEQTFLLIKSIEQSSILINNDLLIFYTFLKTSLNIKIKYHSQSAPSELVDEDKSEDEELESD